MNRQKDQFRATVFDSCDQNTVVSGTLASDIGSLSLMLLCSRGHFRPHRREAKGIRASGWEITSLKDFGVFGKTRAQAMFNGEWPS